MMLQLYTLHETYVSPSKFVVNGESLHCIRRTGGSIGVCFNRSGKTRCSWDCSSREPEWQGCHGFILLTSAVNGWWLRRTVYETLGVSPSKFWFNDFSDLDTGLTKRPGRLSPWHVENKINLFRYKMHFPNYAIYSMLHKDTSPASWRPTVYVTHGGSRSKSWRNGETNGQPSGLTKKPWLMNLCLC